MATAVSSTFLRRYLYSMSQTPHRLRKRMLATWTPDQELNQVRQRSGADMKRKLKWFDLVALGVGGMLGVGVFVTTGPVALHVTGPAVFLSYIIAGISALLSSLCYTEFSVHVSAAGGAFSYLRLTFGEFVGYFAGANIIMEYVLSNAAVARSFTEYLCVAFGESEPNAWRVEVHGSAKNLVKPGGLAPFGVKGVLDGAAIVYFSYIGYDSASTLAEEIQNPTKSLPIGIVGSVIITSALYCLMALSLSLMLPYNQISEKAAFSIAFQRIGWKWASNVIGGGASLGIVASLLVAMLGQARYLCAIGRARLVPFWLAKVHPSTGTPLNATLFLGLCTASIALFTELYIVIEMISIGTLMVFYLVANATIYRRYVMVNKHPPSRILLFLFLLSCSAIGFSLSWKLNQQWWPGHLFFGVSTISIIAFFHYKFPSHDTPEAWSVPYMPWPAATSIFLNVFLMTTLRMLSFQRFAIWSCLITLFYVVYGVHSTYKAEEITMEVNNRVGEGTNNVNSTVQQSKLDIQVL